MNEKWLGSRDIKRLEGTLKPSAYVARAYKYARQNHGIPPKWAKKSQDGHWLFDPKYIKVDADRKLESISVKTAASLLGVSRRAIQTWVDEGEISIVEGEKRAKGTSRQIAKEPFLQNLLQLKMRLETPAVVGHRKKHGKPVPESLMERIEAERRIRKAEARERHLVRQRERRKVLREAKLLDTVRARRRKERENKFAALETQLKKAKETKLKKIRWEEQAAHIAEQIIDDMFDDVVSPIRALTKFNQTTTTKGIPNNIQMKVKKKFFGK